MTMFTEGNIQITFPGSVSARKFDDPTTHGLSNCMKAVDFIVEDDGLISFIEIKDPDHPHARKADREKFIDEFLSGRLDEDLKYKYRDSFLYRWATDGVDKPVNYWVIIALDVLTEIQLNMRTDDLKSKLPLNRPPSGKWKRPIVADCMMFNIETWNKHQRRFPLSRIS